MKQLLLISFFLTIVQTSIAQELAVYDRFANFEKAIIKNDDKIYVINFWATWCAPCIKELPYFEKLHQQNKNVIVILASLDSKKDIEKKLIPFVKRRKITAQVVSLNDKDYNSWLPKIDQDWSGSIPATFIFSGNQKLFAEREFDNFNELNDYVNTFINQKK
ncbi:TlpA family protein disulfide reductase [Flavobacterium sangjuense]|uniref:Thiol-disulfide oxidoreductase ResA n=1 Tax=Flavobacterium sangjuense TaxID=2518177 RepID=A0A4V1CC26_9FLAO|nr:TlpA disulfide reductase family protein [Flavobacterium sangjuense]QBZ98014.1 Thiol-disulfide oxidoreductase ResA [Flavobacterium sangjuense]